MLCCKVVFRRLPGCYLANLPPPICDFTGCGSPFLCHSSTAIFLLDPPPRPFHVKDKSVGSSSSSPVNPGQQFSDQMNIFQNIWREERAKKIAEKLPSFSQVSANLRNGKKVGGWGGRFAKWQVQE